MAPQTPRELITRGSNKRLLILAIATGQAIANLPPILEMAEAGDKVLWLETPLARRASYSVGSRRVISKRNRGIIQSELDIAEHPNQVAAAVREAIAAYPVEEWDVVLVGNGGTKPISGAIGAFLAAQSRAHSAAYGQDQRAEFWLQPEGVLDEVKVLPLTRSRLSLQKVLESSGHGIWEEKNKTPKRLWPMGETLDEDDYGIDAAATGNAHRQAQEIADAYVASDVRKVNCEAVVRFAPRRLEGLRKMIETLPHGAPSDGTLKGIFRNVMNTAEIVSRSAEFALRGIESPRSLGPRFELAVARRIQRWTQTASARLPVNEVWWGVAIAAESNPSVTIAEFDIVFVLANGLLYSLECKSHLAEEGEARTQSKDFDARLFNLQKTGSRLAKIAICAPLFTAFAGERWFIDLHKKVLDRVAPPFDYIGFTLPEQPERYELEYEAAGGVERRDFVAHPFEATLDRLLSRYAPAR